MTDHPAFQPGHVAVVTGAASGIGLDAARRFAALGLKICLVDLAGPALENASRDIAMLTSGGAGDVMAAAVDVSDPSALTQLEQDVTARFGPVSVLMNNAGIQPGSAILGGPNTWERIIAVNLWGVVHGSRIFAPGMIAGGGPGVIINTGSKQGITTPPGDPAYNMAKSGVKTFTEALQHELRNIEGCRVSAHLLIPGFVFTGLTRRDRTAKPAGAWTPEQTVDFMMGALGSGDFYILCPDNDVTRAVDERRIAWAAGDIIENRPPLSRWHPDYKVGFEAFLKS